MIEGVDYIYEYPKNDPEFVYIRIIEGEYENTLYKYGKVKFDTERSPDEAYLTFEYEVIESKVKKPNKLQKDPKFKAVIGELLIQIITIAAENEIITSEDVLDEFGSNNS